MGHFHYVDLRLVEVSLGLVEVWSGLEEGLGWFQDRLESHVDFAVPEISICTPPPVVSSARRGHSVAISRLNNIVEKCFKIKCRKMF